MGNTHHKRKAQGTKTKPLWHFDIGRPGKQKKAASKLDDEGRWSVHYKPSQYQHQQENIFLPSTRPPHIEDLHKEAEIGLKSLRGQGTLDGYSQLHLGNGQDSGDDCSLQSQDEDVPLIEKSGSRAPNDEVWAKTRSLPPPTPDEIRKDKLSARSGVIPTGTTFKPPGHQKTQSSFKGPKLKEKRIRRTTIMGLPQHIQQELGLGKSSRLSSTGVKGPGADSASVVDTSRGDGNHCCNNVSRSRVRGSLRSINFTESSEGGNESISTLELNGQQNWGLIDFSQRPKSLAIPKSSIPSELLQSPVMSMSPQATYLSKIIPNAILPAAVDVVMINTSQNCLRTLSRSSLVCAPSPACSRSIFLQNSDSKDYASSDAWSHSQSSETIVSNNSTISSQGHAGIPQNNSSAEKDRETSKDKHNLTNSAPDHHASTSRWVSACAAQNASAVAEDTPAHPNANCKTNELHGNGYDDQTPSPAQSTSSIVDASDTQSITSERSIARSLSVRKMKRPPAPPRRINSLQQAEEPSSPGADDVFSPLLTQASRTQFEVCTDSPVGAGSTTSPLVNRKLAAAKDGMGEMPKGSILQSSNNVPPKYPTSPNKSERTMSPSSGYSSQSGTPTMVRGLVSPSPPVARSKPTAPERSSSLVSPEMSHSSSLASISSSISEHVDLFVIPPPPSSPAPPPPTVKVATSPRYTWRPEVIPPPPAGPAPLPPTKKPSFLFKVPFSFAASTRAPTVTTPASTVTPAVTTPASTVTPAVTTSAPTVTPAVTTSAPAVTPAVTTSAPTVTPAVTTSAPAVTPAVTTSAPTVTPAVTTCAPTVTPAVTTSAPTVTPAVTTSASTRAPAVTTSAPTVTPLVTTSAPAVTPLVTTSAPAVTPAVTTSAPTVTPAVTTSAPTVTPAVTTSPTVTPAVTTSAPAVTLPVTTSASTRAPPVTTSASTRASPVTTPVAQPVTTPAPAVAPPVTGTLAAVLLGSASTLAAPQIASTSAATPVSSAPPAQVRQELTPLQTKVTSSPPSPPPSHHPPPPPKKTAVIGKISPPSSSTVLEPTKQEPSPLDWPPPPPPLSPSTFTPLSPTAMPSSSTSEKANVSHSVQLQDAEFLFPPPPPSLLADMAREKRYSAEEPRLDLQPVSPPAPPPLLPDSVKNHTIPGQSVAVALSSPPPPPSQPTESRTSSVPKSLLSSVPSPATSTSKHLQQKPHVVSGPPPAVMADSRLPKIMAQTPKAPNRDSDKELLVQSSPNQDGGQASIPIVTPSLLQMVRLRSVQVSTYAPGVPDSKQQVSKNQLDLKPPTKSNATAPNKPARKSLSLRLPSSPDSEPQIKPHNSFSVKTPTDVQGQTALRSPDDGALHKSPASTASFIFSKNLNPKKLVFETPRTPEAEAEVKRNFMAELSSVSGRRASKTESKSSANPQSKAASEAPSVQKKPGRVPPPVAKKPSFLPSSQRLPSTSTVVRGLPQAEEKANALKTTSDTKEEKGKLETGNGELAVCKGD